MAKLTKNEANAHQRACDLLAGTDRLTIDQAIEIVENWHEGASHLNTRASAHFTPWELARHAALEIGGGRIIDLCAGTGILSLAARDRLGDGIQFTLVEINPDYCEVARRLLPDAEIICGSLFDSEVLDALRGRRWDYAISNPPFGTFARGGQATNAPRYTGGELHYAVIDIAADLASEGVFILPQQAVPFRYSGRQGYEHHGGDQRYVRFTEQTGIELGANVGIDTTVLPSFRGVNIVTEISTVDFREAAARRESRDMPLFGVAA